MLVASTDPLLSVIIPTRNRSERLSKLLQSLAVQEKTDFAWEVLVIDNNSQDSTAEVVEKVTASFPVSLRYLHEPKFGLHSGRNRGAREAKGKYISYLDDDMTLSPSWLRGVQMLREGKAQAVVGKILPAWEGKPPDFILALMRNGVLGALGILDLGEEIKPVRVQLVFGGNSFFPRQLILDLGGFNPDAVPPELIKFRGDGEYGLMLKFQEAGHVSYYDPIALAYHAIEKNRMTVDYLKKRAFLQGISSSYTQLRTIHGLYRDMSRANQTGRWQKVWDLLCAGKVRELGHLLGRKLCSLFRREEHMIDGEQDRWEKIIGESASDGFNFHQREVANDPELFRWVVRENYWD